MSASTWIELVGLLVGGGGGGAVVARLTRLVVSVEDLAAQIGGLKTAAATTAAAVAVTAQKVQDHEVRITKAGLLQQERRRRGPRQEVGRGDDREPDHDARGGRRPRGGPHGCPAMRPAWTKAPPSAPGRNFSQRITCPQPPPQMASTG